MDAEIVLDQNDGLGVREVDVGQVFQDASVIHGGMAICDLDVAPAFERSKHHEEIGGAIALVLIIETGRASSFHRDRHARFGNELLRGLVESRSIIYSLRLLQVRHEQAVRHSLLKVPDHCRLACRDRDCQRLAPSRSELDDIGPVALRAKDHDPVVASHYRRLVLPQSSSASRFTAGAARLFILSQSGERPERYIESLRFDTMPSSPILQAWAKTVGPSPSMCSLNRMPGQALPSRGHRPQALSCMDQ